MITRRNLAEQLRNYQLESGRHWSSLSFWRSTTRGVQSRAIQLVLVILVACLTSVTVFYTRDLGFSFLVLGVGIIFLVFFEVVGSKLAKRKQRRILPS